MAEETERWSEDSLGRRIAERSTTIFGDLLMTLIDEQQVVVFWRCLVVVGLLAGPAARAGYEVPGKLPASEVVLEHATVHPASSAPIEDAVLVMYAGKIRQIGRFGKMSLRTAEGAERIDLTGLHVYPGLIDADSAMGLIEIDAVRATVDLAETGSINPNVRGHVAFNPDSEMVPVARAGGVLLTLTVPRGGLLSGQSSLMRLDGWTSDEMTVAPSVGMHLNWPRPRRDGADGDKGDQSPLDELRDWLRNARSYAAAEREETSSTGFDARLAALVPVVTGQQPLFVHADDVRAIQEAVAFCQQEQLELVIVGGYDAPHCSDLLKRHEIPVIVNGTQRLPRRRHADYDEPFRLPARLSEQHVKYCIGGHGRFSASLVQNLPHHAGLAAAYGLSRAEALKAITLYPAEILGVADRYGSLEAGKSATLIVANGDLLEVTTSIESAWLDGRPVDLNNRHKRLWRKYQQRYTPMDDSATGETPKAQ